MTDFHAIPPELRPRIDAYLSSTAWSGRTVRLVPLTPDASDRRYFRVVPQAGNPVVLAVYSGPIAFASMPFSNVAELLRHMELPVPAVLGHRDDLGIIEQEDLGDVTLQAVLGGDAVSVHAECYREAIRLIHQLQERGRTFASPAWVPYTLAFDVEKLTFELNFFAQHFLEGHRKVSFSAAERAALTAEWSAIVDELSAEPRVVCHRDYHSRNLMLHRGRLYMIDFQDTRMGPDTYDLVSLLRDSYVDLTEFEVEGFIEYFVSIAGIADRTEFRRRFDLMSVQRNIKALGTFGFQASARGNPAYVQYMPRTLAHVRRNLLGYERFSRLHELLGAHVPELR